MLKVVKELEPLETASTLYPRRRLVVLQRTDGNFMFAEEYHYTSEYDGKVVAEGWARMRPFGIYDTAETAEAEGRAAYPDWYGPRE